MRKTRYYTNDGNEVKLGDFIDTVKKKQTKYGFIKTCQTFRLSEESIPYLLDKGLITAKVGGDKDESKPREEVTFTDVVDYVREEMGCDTDDVMEFLGVLYGESTQAMYDLVYRKVADILEETRYGDIPLEGPLYYISEVDHSIKTLAKGDRYNPDFVTVFRTKEDAIMAIKVAKTVGGTSRKTHG